MTTAKMKAATAMGNSGPREKGRNMEGYENQLNEILIKIMDLENLIKSQGHRREYLTTVEAARELGRAVWTVQQYLRSGALRGERSGARVGPFVRWVIHIDEVERFKREGPNRDREAPGALPSRRRPKNPPNAPAIRKQPEWPVV